MKRSLLLPLALLTGCVYYNGMYNTRHFTHEAEKAAREGRTLDANTAWGQVTVKAETLLARHPTSKYAPEARVLMGRAYAELGDCASARAPLEAGLVAVDDSTLRREGRLALARCYETLGQPARAAAILQELFTSATERDRTAMRAELVRALRLGGEYAAGLEALGEGNDSLAGERLALLAGAGRTEEAATLAATLAQQGDTAAPWDSAAALAGRHDPAAGSRIVDAMLQLPGMTPSGRAQTVLADARRLAAIDTAAALARYAQVDSLKPTADLRARAEFETVQLRLAHARTPDALDAPAARLSAMSEDSPLAFDARTLLGTVDRLRAVRDSVTVDTPAGDLRYFLAGEVSRDSLRAPALADYFFRHMADLWPASPYAPKALLAARLLAPDDSMLRERIDSLYAGSPYVMAVRGDDPPGLRSLEDSLGAFARSQVRPPESRPARARPGRREPDATPTRPRPAPGQRVPEVR